MDRILCETETTVGNFSILKKLGEGQFSIVKLCQQKFSSPSHSFGIKDNNKVEKLAVKIIEKAKIRSIDGVLRIENELTVLKLLGRHENVVQFKDVLHGVVNLYIFTEYLPMDLFAFIEAFKTKFNENIVAVIMCELLAGLQYIHKIGVVHRCRA